MIYTPLTNKAMRIAYNAHHGQLDYNGIPYIFHPIHLAEQMEEEISCCAALLHDVVEDTAVTLDDLRREFPGEVVAVVALLTHKPGVDYFDYVRAIRQNPIAKKVKLADLAHNSDQTRCVGSSLTQEQLHYWKEKYEKARAILTEE
ncbi:MAG: HD domain-containing protein [Eubacteriales bacterium]|nr:HD domain-containing protein [Eubacteriales bacterium]